MIEHDAVIVGEKYCCSAHVAPSSKNRRWRESVVPAEEYYEHDQLAYWQN